MSQLRLFGLFVVVACFTAAGCSDASSGSGAGDDGDGAGGDGRRSDGDDHDGGEDGEVASGPTTACVRYLDCVAAVDPARLSEAEESVGEDGPCWDGDAERRASCNDGCLSGLAEEREAAPGEERCAECTEDAECDDEREGRCVYPGHAGFCAECWVGADCATGYCNRDLACAVREDDPERALECIEDIGSSWNQAGLPFRCVEPCAATLDAGCGSTDLCCLESASDQCGPDAACVYDYCELEASCTDAIAGARQCLMECCTDC